MCFLHPGSAAHLHWGPQVPEQEKVTHVHFIFHMHDFINVCHTSPKLKIPKLFSCPYREGAAAPVWFFISSAAITLK